MADPVPLSPEPRRLPVVKLALLLLVAAVVAVLLMKGLPVRAWAGRGVGLIQGAGPWAYFAAMALLPAFGAPLLGFTLPAGELFAARMGIPGVLAAALAALAVNLVLTYWLARYALRPPLQKLVARYGYAVPRVERGNALTVVLCVRLTPGPPYFLQSYILGLAEVPFRLFVVVSWLCLIPWVSAAVILGRGLFAGNFRMVLIGTGFVVAAAALFHFLRRKYASRAG